MEAPVASVRLRHFYWGHSMGIATLGLAGLFWLTRAAVSFRDLTGAIHGEALVLWGVLIAVPSLVLALLARRVRQKAAGFSRHDLRRPELAASLRTATRRWRWNSLAQLIGCALAAVFGTWLQRPDLIWPGIALVVSLHFVAFGRPYLIMSVMGTLVAAAALVLPVSLLAPAARSIFLGVGMGVVAWAAGTYVAWRADAFARAYAKGL